MLHDRRASPFRVPNFLNSLVESTPSQHEDALL
jgi:hypothetical protein